MSRCSILSVSGRHLFPVNKGFDGYAPIMAYIGDEGFLVNTELREGKQHSQKGTPDFLRETLRLAHQMTDQQLLIRMDSGNDAAENLGWRHYPYRECPE